MVSAFLLYMQSKNAHTVTVVPAMNGHLRCRASVHTEQVSTRQGDINMAEQSPVPCERVPT